MNMYRLGELNLAQYKGVRLIITAVIKDVQVKQMKNGQDMLNVTVVDKQAKRLVVWFGVSKADTEKAQGLIGKVCDITVDVKPYAEGEDGVSLIIYDAYENVNLPIDLFVPSVENINYYVDNMNNLLTMCKDTVFYDIAVRLLNKYWDTFSVVPAAKSNHHVLKGGLLMHSVSVALGCYNSYLVYTDIYGQNFLNLPLLLCGALIHDIGKCFELDYDNLGGAVYSDTAYLETHIMRGLSEIDKVVTELDIMEDRDEILELKHMIASHHGKLEFGSPIKPSMPEAVILAAEDEKDARMNCFSNKFAKLEPATGDVTWGADGMTVYYKSAGPNGSPDDSPIGQVVENVQETNDNSSVGLVV